MIGCTSDNCHQWLHEECIKHDALLRTFKRLGKDKPHVSEAAKAQKEEQATRPLSPTEPGAAQSAQQSIDVKAGSGSADSVKADDNVDVKPGDDAAPEDDQDAASSSKTPARARCKSRKSEGSFEPKGKPYEGLFDVELKMDLSPPMLEFRDLRRDVAGGEKSWLEPIDCVVCGTQVH